MSTTIPEERPYPDGPTTPPAAEPTDPAPPGGPDFVPDSLPSFPAPVPPPPIPPPPPEEVQGDIADQLGDLDNATRAIAGGGFGLDLAGEVPDDPATFDPMFGLGSDLDAFSAPRYEATPPPRREPDVQAFGGKARTLDDLYHQFPKLKSGEFMLRIERTKPLTFRNKPCGGWVKDLSEPIDMNRFQQQFGGGTYLVSVMGSSTSSMGSDGYTQRTLGHITLMFPGSPILSEDEDMHNPRRFAGLDHSATEAKRMELDYQERKGLRDRGDQLTSRLLETATGGKPDWDTLERLSTQRAEDIRQASSEATGVLRHELERLRKELSEAQEDARTSRQEKDQAIAQMRDEVHKIRHESLQAATREETTRMTELKRAHAEELRRINEGHSAKVHELATENRTQVRDTAERAEREMTAATDRHAREVRDLTDRFERQIDRDKADIDRRLASMQAEHQRTLDHQKSMYEMRLNESSRANDRELRSVKESFAAQIEAVRMTEQSTANSIRLVSEQNTSIAQMNAHRSEAEADRLRAELDRADAELRSQHKDPLTAVTEAKSLLDTLGLNAKEDGTDWKSQMGAIARSLTDKLPDMIGQVQGIREQNRHLAAAAQHQQHAPPPRQMVAGPVARHPVQRAARMPPPGMGAPMGNQSVGGSPLGHAGTHAPVSAAPLGSTAAQYAPQAFGFDEEDGPAVPAVGAHAPPPPPVTRQPDINGPITPPGAPDHSESWVAAPPPGNMHGPDAPPPLPPGMAYPPGMGPPPAGPPAGPAAPVQHAPPPAPPVPQAPPPATPAQHAPPPVAPLVQHAAPAAPVEIDPEFVGKIGKIVDQLEAAIKGQVIGPRLFAEGFVAEVGLEQAVHIVRQVSADDFCTAVRAQVPNSAIVTVDGADYVAACWAEVYAMAEAPPQ